MRCMPGLLKSASCTIELPAKISPVVAYAVAVVKGAKHPAAAQKFVAGLLKGDGRAALQKAGFSLPHGV